MNANRAHETLNDLIVLEGFFVLLPHYVSIQSRSRFGTCQFQV